MDLGMNTLKETSVFPLDLVCWRQGDQETQKAWHIIVMRKQEIRHDVISWIDAADSADNI